ncbi:hypothetical protein [Croceimicrobium hydrocarbonivorans]|uniref:Uncharacterized protein n=1 Tax=Croceimicrobium hydrocarbonivorans TaxID=2761580 RepID=A0A7H0VD56_9FLAO|nr:hypothetical protein [Croceimicrobium hydrocarbonivorans]QNR23654.1 hypothetical protein H4K34_14920 [Croceimicrobium hydrocarbonivorans]
MTEKKKLNEDQIWTLVMTILPMMLLGNVGRELTDDSLNRVLFGALLGGIGAGFGFAINYMVKDKGRISKILASIAILVVSGLALYFLISKPSDEEILDQEWLRQKIGKVEFDSPSELKLQSSEIPESAKWFYSELKLYTDEGEDRIVALLKTKIRVDTFSLANAFSYQLEGTLSQMKVDLEHVDLEFFMADEEEVSAMFSFSRNGKAVNGYGYMYKYENSLESIWLMPIKQGFSKEYIEVFDSRIIPDYE